MRFLVDQCVPVEVSEALRAAGHDADHTSERGLGRATDEEILAVAVSEERVVVSADTDLGGLLADQEAALPSVVLYRRQARRRPHELAIIL